MFFQSTSLWNVLFCFTVALNLISHTKIDFIFVLFALGGAYEAYKNKHLSLAKQFYITPTIFNSLVGVFVFSYMMGYFLGSPMSSDQWEEIAKIRWILGFYCSYYIGKKLQYAEYPTNKLLLPFLGISFLAVITYHWISYQSLVISASYRLRGFYDNPNNAAYAAALIFTFLLAHLIVIKSQFKERLSLVIVLSLNALMLFATYSRGAWLACIVAIIASGFYVKNRKLYYFFGISSIVTILLYLNNCFELRDRIMYSFDISHHSSQGQRLNVWKVNWAIFLDHPLFGVGMRESAFLYPTYYTKLGLPADIIPQNAHNQFLQVLAGAGIIGLISYLGIFCFGYLFFHRAFNSHNDPKKKAIALGAILTIIAITICSLTDSPVDIQEFRNYVLLLLGFSFGFLRDENIRFANS